VQQALVAVEVALLLLALVRLHGADVVLALARVEGLLPEQLPAGQLVVVQLLAALHLLEAVQLQLLPQPLQPVLVAVQPALVEDLVLLVADQHLVQLPVQEVNLS